jgi:Arc/MetJ-type ribon-helix-helix transcriptional regulator
MASNASKAKMNRMNIPITSEIEQLVHGIYAGGEYAIEADVLAAALRLLEQRDRFRSHLQQGCDELDQGASLDADQVFAELRQRAVSNAVTPSF